jgi:hypothetical protein
MAEAGKRPVYLINGAQFVRYIRYVRGSRRDDDDTLTTLSPEFFAGKEQPNPSEQISPVVLAPFH